LFTWLDWTLFVLFLFAARRVVTARLMALIPCVNMGKVEQSFEK
jgi:hypothetical protein